MSYLTTGPFENIMAGCNSHLEGHHNCCEHPFWMVLCVVQVLREESHACWWSICLCWVQETRRLPSSHVSQYINNQLRATLAFFNCSWLQYPPHLTIMPRFRINLQVEDDTGTTTQWFCSTILQNACWIPRSRSWLTRWRQATTLLLQNYRPF